MRHRTDRRSQVAKGRSHASPGQRPGTEDAQHRPGEPQGAARVSVTQIRTWNDGHRDPVGRARDRRATAIRAARWGSAMICPPPTPGRGPGLASRCHVVAEEEARPARMAKRFRRSPVRSSSSRTPPRRAFLWRRRAARGRCVQSPGLSGGTVSVRHGAAPAFTASLANEVRANATPPGLAMSAKE